MIFYYNLGHGYGLFVFCVHTYPFFVCVRCKLGASLYDATRDSIDGAKVTRWNPR